MSDIPKPVKKAKAHIRRISNPSPKKQAKRAAKKAASNHAQAAEKKAAEEKPKLDPLPVEQTSVAAPEPAPVAEEQHEDERLPFPLPEPEIDFSGSEEDKVTIATVVESIPENETDGDIVDEEETAGVISEPDHREPSSNSKRKRKRSRSRNNQGNGNGNDAADPSPASAPSPRLRHPAEEVSKRAWKIYLAEISEEGVALVSDNDARDLARRCFRLAEIFLDEEARRKQ